MRRPTHSRLRLATLTRPGQGKVSQRLPRLLLLPLPPHHRAIRQNPAGLQIPAHHPVQRRQRGRLSPGILQVPVQHRHVPARLRQHLPRLVGQLQPGPRPALHTALRPRRIKLQQPRHQHRPGRLLKAGGRQRTDATHVLAAVRTLSHLELVGETLRAALEELAEAAPTWLTPLIEPEWIKRYGRRVEIGKLPGGKAAVTARAEEFGRDGQKILTAAWAAYTPPHLRFLPQVEILRQVWVHHYYWDMDGALRWRDGHALSPASLRFDSPYDTDAHYCVKRDTAWSGYRTHFTETCDEERPELVVHVATTISTVQDIELTETIHDELAERQLLPAEHVVDSGYISPARIERARRVHGITLLGPVSADHSAQAKAGSGFGKAAFTIDWNNEQAICPRGATSVSWTKLNIKDHTYLQARFAEADCRACPDRTQCTTSATGPRSIAVLPRPLHEIQMRNRLEQRTEQWQRHYAIRAGIEATLSQNVRAYGLRRSRFHGLARTHVQHVLTALACNITRVSDWVSGTPRTRRRTTRFHTLCLCAATT